ncbi:TonB-dependent receptor plug domain-containing protein [Psychrobacter sanguinis]|uniref:TonB-dependent receptor n=1 Tax=Psychrobacter sanguinis TaxID=861445 RepID=A0A844M084_9GAMM|nr:TonB-dependent receptor [Psychrobacter sanguinis]MUG32184.1 TonB-dependent receptor [Psychrobacter sanguinis]
MKTSYSPLYRSVVTALASSNLTPKALTIVSALAVCMPAMAAQNQGEVDAEQPRINFPAITVTATRTPTAVNNTIAQTRVIDSQELSTYKGQTVLDVLKRQPGFSYKQNGGMGTTSNFYLRGYDNKSILVLIDGVRYSTLSAGGSTLELLPAEQIDRIEVLYGASGSSIYGADAVGGVIQIFTKGQNVDQNQFSVTAGAGTNDHYLYGASAQMRNENGSSLSLAASRNQTKGYSALLPDPSNPYSYYNSDNDGFESNNYSLRLNQHINTDVDVGISGLYSESETEFDNGPSTGKDRTKAKQKNGAAQAFANWRYAPGSTVKLAYGHSIDESDNPTYSSFYNTKQDQVSLVGQHKLSVGTGIYGLEYLKQNLDSNQYDSKSRKSTSGFLGYLTTYNNIDAQVNVRYDDYSDFDSEATYNLGVGYHFTPELRAGINYAKGYRVPTLGDLYSPDSWGGNPNLDPEKSDNYEAFIEHVTSNQSTRLTGYYNDIEDLISSTKIGVDSIKYPYGQLNNIEKAKVKGITLTSDWNIDDYLFGLSYDYQKAENDSGNANDGNYLPNRPKNKGMFYLGYQLSDLDVRAEYEYVDNFYADAGNFTKLNDYSLVNISGNYQLTPALSMSARLNNVFNKKYVTNPGYSTDDGTNFFTSLTYTWK